MNVNFPIVRWALALAALVVLAWLMPSRRKAGLQSQTPAISNSVSMLGPSTQVALSTNSDSAMTLQGTNDNDRILFGATGSNEVNQSNSSISDTLPDTDKIPLPTFRPGEPGWK